MDSQRVVMIMTDDTDAHEDLRHLLSVAVNPPWKPVPDGESRATYKQERWSQEETDEYLLHLLKRAAPRLHWLASGIVPEVERGV